MTDEKLHRGTSSDLETIEATALVRRPPRFTHFMRCDVLLTQMDVIRLLAFVDLCHAGAPTTFAKRL